MAKTRKPTASTIELLPKQYAFVTSTAREVLYSGAFGAGKSRATCVKLATRAQRPGAREALVRKHLVTLKGTTLKTLLEPEGNLPPVLPPGSYSHNQSAKTIRIVGGGEIVYFGLDDVAKVGSYNLSGVGVDQAEELSENDWTALRGRIRLNVDGVPNSLYGACNPSGPEHFLAVRFGLNGRSKAADGCHAIATKSADNWHLPESYLRDLQTYTGVAKRRYVDGEWCGSDGLVYDTFDPAIHVRERRDVWQRVIVGGDQGFSNPTAMVVIAEAEDGTLHLLAEFYATGKVSSDVIAEAERLKSEYGVTEFVFDPAAAVLREEMARAGLSVIAGDNDVNGGITSCQRRFAVDGSGKPGLTISPACVNVIKELGMYEWQPGEKDKPVKKHDHALDALRYGIRRLDGGNQIDVRVINGGNRSEPHRPTNDEHMWQTFQTNRGHR
ncbi:PBSX family phage terminase large subunit [Humisphaera borealis]|uniref:Phage terminase large subunit N-terminal domain-containing protein n=1 Tax=Humisphaera borealis TaxID=2807512 RepID=A0A7M2X088_9BACT|nr:phage terminase large subunit [Humisphaera borealis]QOV91069.1 hypothetical protein IPV69_06835 [Humisphaera borealis]